MTEAVVIGGGHNGLVCAAYLARAGCHVTVVEAAQQVGGACVTRSFAEGFRVSAGAHLLYHLHPDVSTELDLAGQGLSMAARDLPTLALDEADRHLRIHQNQVSGEGLSAGDREAYASFHDRMTRYAGLLAKTLTRPPPRLVEGGLRDRLALGHLALQLRLLGRSDMRELLRIGAINIFDVLNEVIDDERLKGALSLDGVLGSHMGPRSPNTVLGYLYRRLDTLFGFEGPSLPLGGMGAVSDALAGAARAAGAEIRTGAIVAEILVEAHRVAGVRLEDGSRLRADVVVSNADPKTTFEQLLGYRQLEAGFARRIQNLRMKGTAAKLHLALDGLPRFSGVTNDELGARLLIAPDMAGVERAFDPVKYDDFGADPVMEISVPTIHDPQLAPEGGHVMSVLVQYLPHQIDGGWDAHRQRCERIVLQKLERYAPGIRAQVIASELLTPADLETQFRIRGGHWHHGELSLDQFLMLRPVPGAARYATPVPGLYLCGAGTHPGGGVMGIAGRNAAQVILDEAPSLASAAGVES